MKHLITLCVSVLVLMGISSSVYSQGLPAQAITNVTVHNADGSSINGATIVWRNGSIDAIGRNLNIPFDAKVIDGGDSLHVYPGMIDGQAYWGSSGQRDFEDTPQYRGQPTYERAGIRPERRAHEAISMDADSYEQALQTGFTTAALGTQGYMIPGQLDLFLIHPELEIGDLYEGGLGMQMQFEESSGVYPSTVMGIVAQLKQLVSDAETHREWQGYYASNATAVPAPENNPTLEALYPVMDNEQRVFFNVDSKEMIERVFKLQDEMGFDVVLVSAMEAYKVADEISDRNISVLASIDFPDEPDWRDKEEEEEIELTEQDKQFREKQWDAYLDRIRNVRMLMDAGVEVGFASVDLELGDFNDNLQTWLEHGEVDADEVLSILTINTAEILGKSQTLGGLDEGQIASFSVMSDTFGSEDAKVLYTISEGQLNEFND